MSAQKILVFARDHEFTALVMDCGPRRYLAAISLRGESNNLKGRIEGASGMYFLEKLAGSLGKRDEHVSDVLRKDVAPGAVNASTRKPQRKNKRPRRLLRQNLPG